MNESFHRIFIALPVNDDKIIQSLTEITRNLSKYGSILKIVPTVNYHITVKFLGQIESNIAESLTQSFMSLTQLNIIDYHIDKIGTFPTKGNPSVIWAGLKCSQTPLVKVINSINELSQSFGFPVEKKSFIPHLTLARIKNNVKIPLELKNYLNSEIELKFSSSMFNELILFESILKKTGPEYKRLGVVNLN